MSFETTMEFVLKWEGGYTNDQTDPGGETNFGINKRDHPNVDIPNLTKEEALEIYRTDYWIPAGCDGMADLEALVTMDCAVNMGVGRSKLFWAEAEAGSYGDWKDFLLIRIKYYVSLRKKYPQFFGGWIGRVADLYDYARKS
jgi:hypothetical protein